MWKNTDPRFEIGKRATILIIKPGMQGKEICFAYVDTKADWLILTDFSDYRVIGVNDNWCEDWIWDFAP